MTLSLVEGMSLLGLAPLVYSLFELVEFGARMRFEAHLRRWETDAYATARVKARLLS